MFARPLRKRGIPRKPQSRLSPTTNDQRASTICAILRPSGDNQPAGLRDRCHQVLGALSAALQPGISGGRDHLLRDRISSVEVCYLRGFLFGPLLAGGDRQCRVLRGLHRGHLCAGVGLSRGLAPIPQASVCYRYTLRRRHHPLRRHGYVPRQTLISSSPRTSSAG